MTRFFTALAAPMLLLGTAPALAAEPAPSAQGIDPARLAAARQTVDYVFPSGTYARLMDGAMDTMMDSILDATTRIPIKDLAELGGVGQEALERKLGPATIAEVMEIYDPVYRERMKLSTRAMMGEMTKLMTEFEPEIRDGLSKAYAARFDTKQLGELNAFFATPTGKAYAADSYAIMMAPEVVSKMETFVPKMMQHMPGIVERMKKATADLPEPRKLADLSKADRQRLAGLLGISENDLEGFEASKAEKSF